MEKKRPSKSTIVDIVVIVSVIILAGFLYTNYLKEKSSVALTPNYIQGSPNIDTLLREQTKNTPLDPSFDRSKISNKFITGYQNTLTFLTQIPVIDNIFHFMNKNQGFVHECISDGEFVDSTVPKIRYPVDLTKKELQKKIIDFPELMIIDVRSLDDYLKAHIPGSVTIPFLELPTQIFNVNRWTEIVVVGDSYLQTKLASEALLRLSFLRVHRLIVPVRKWGRELITFN
jgi:rhodanese-related sulfurtransferase